MRYVRPVEMLKRHSQPPLSGSATASARFGVDDGGSALNYRLSQIAYLNRCSVRDVFAFGIRPKVNVSCQEFRRSSPVEHAMGVNQKRGRDNGDA